MAKLTDITTSVQTVTATGAVTPTAGVSISGMTADATIVVEVIQLSSAATAKLSLESSTISFSSVTSEWEIDIQGQIGQSSYTQNAYNPCSARFSKRLYEIPNAPFGTASALLRVNVLQLTAASSLSLHAWIEN